MHENRIGTKMYHFLNRNEYVIPSNLYYKHNCF